MITDEMLRDAAEASLRAHVNYLEADYDPGDQHVFSGTFERKMQKLIRKAKHPVFYRVAKRAAVFLLAVLLGASVWLGADTRARAAFFGWAKGLHETYLAYRHSNGDSEANNEYMKPVWLPDGYALLFEEDTGDQFLAVYTNEAGDRLLSFSCIYKPGQTDIFVDMEGAVFSSVIVGSYSADLLHFEDEEKADVIMWTGSNGSAYVISGYLTASELTKIANSLYAK